MGQVNWQAHVNGKIEVERAVMVWELMARPSLKHAAEVWWPGDKIIGRKLESVQEKVGKKLLGASDNGRGGSVCELGWKKLAERREEKKMLFGQNCG